MKCRHCAHPLELVFLDLGFAPPSNAYLDAAALHRAESWFPLKLYTCTQCWLVQTEDHAGAHELFAADYAYFSSTSVSWLDHAACYSRDITRRLGLGAHSHVIEVASNDGYLLRNFVQAGISCLGIEPTASTAQAAERLGVPVLREFFGAALGRQLAAQGRSADLVIGNNVFAHVPDINDFTLGLREVLKPGGTVTLEFPHLMRLIEQAQFDTVYHEHYSYLSLGTTMSIFGRAGLRVFDVEELATHGGSLRVYGCHRGDPRVDAPAVAALLATEAAAGLQGAAAYQGFQARADRIKNDLLAFLIEQKRLGHRVAAYGAAAKGNTLLNYAGVRPDLLPYICDAAPSKQGRFTPGGHIPILEPAQLEKRRPDVVLVLPWNLVGEVTQQLGYIRGWGARFYTCVPGMKEA
ncbi:methyltransferase domain-containing protein [Caenimonas aquaedulcis]|uniref:methyltransferase domain-containing protein n=1 Tax=Caenimonas aquaedulcis TaxID=2793270 RepID=UPI0018CBE78F